MRVRRGKFPLLGWESFYDLPGDVHVLHSRNLHWTYDEQLINLLEQAVVISQVRVIATLKTR
eukprot:12372314-Alexandrium_andersonii.AAC.1